MLPPTYCHTDSSTCNSKTDIVGQGDIDAKYSRVIEELTEDHLAVRSGRGFITDSFHWSDAVGIRNDRADLSW